MIDDGIADHAALAIAGAVGSLYHQFGTAVAIKVVDDEGRIVGTRADITA